MTSIADLTRAANIARRHRDRALAEFAATGDRKALSRAIDAQEAVRAAGRLSADRALASA